MSKKYTRQEILKATWRKTRFPNVWGDFWIFGILFIAVVIAYFAEIDKFNERTVLIVSIMPVLYLYKYRSHFLYPIDLILLKTKVVEGLEVSFIADYSPSSRYTVHPRPDEDNRTYIRKYRKSLDEKKIKRLLVPYNAYNYEEYHKVDSQTLFPSETNDNYIIKAKFNVLLLSNFVVEVISAETIAVPKSDPKSFDRKRWHGWQ
ncbi:MAG: hypothetical protein R3Y24_02785 [Eubacteriales bacterium]